MNKRTYITECRMRLQQNITCSECARVSVAFFFLDHLRLHQEHGDTVASQHTVHRSLCLTHKVVIARFLKVEYFYL